MNLLAFQKMFGTEEACVEFFANQRWGSANSSVCPHCKSKHTCKHSTRGLYTCMDCKKQFTVRIGTIFEDSRVPLTKWFIAIYLFTSLKKGLSSIQLSKYIEVTQKTAWFMLQRIREVMKDDYNPFDGITEIDEAYLGGKEGNKHLHNKGKMDKATVIGMVNRDTKQVKAMKVVNNEAEYLLPKVHIHTKRQSTIITDNYFGYNSLKKNYTHQTVKHSAGEYVRNDARIAFKIHTNSIEGFWSHLKRGINGIYHWCSKKHLQSYLNEYSSRYNTKDLTDFERFTVWFGSCEGKKLVYSGLVG